MRIRTWVSSLNLFAHPNSPPGSRPLATTPRQLRAVCSVSDAYCLLCRSHIQGNKHGGAANPCIVLHSPGQQQGLN